jgi:two-component system response regulator HydG
VVAATHQDLPALVKSGGFREDLYYRLNVVTIALPALRERRQDIPLLFDRFLRRLAARHGRGPVAVDPGAAELLVRYDWPGNVRELQNVLERAVVLAAQDVIGPEHLPPELRAHESTSIGPTTLGAQVPLAEVEREHVLGVLASVQGSRERAATILGISRRTLSRMLQRWTD